MSLKFFFSAQAQTCFCNQGYYFDISQSNECQKCFTNSTSSMAQQVGVFQIQACDSCLPNFYFYEKNPYMVNNHMVFVPICIECPQGAGTNQVSFQITSCNICLQNYYMESPASQSPTPSSASCLPCPYGTVSSGAQIVDQSVCNSCPVNSYMIQSSIPASQNNDNKGVAAQCSFCPNGSGNLIGSNQLGDISQCSMCLENYYMVSPAIQPLQQSKPSAAQCLPCPANSYNNKNSQLGFCICFDQNATSLSQQVSSCNCKDGYFGSVSTSLNSPSGCFQCPQGQYSNRKTQYTCKTCPSKFVTNQAQSDCICNITGLGVILDDSTQICTCKNGYQEDITSLSGCSPCPIGFYSNINTQKNCQKCPSKFVINQAQSDCICNVNGLGVVLDSKNNICMCKNGYYEDNSSISGCSPCPQGQYSNSKTQYTCKTCPSKFVTNQAQSDCICNVNGLGVVLDSKNNICMCKNGYYEDNSSISGCSPCPQGQYSNSSTSYKCTSCPSGSYTNHDQSNCICNDQSIAVYFDPVSIACKCQNGYFGNPSQATLITIGSCTPCPKQKLQVTNIQNEIMKFQCESVTFSNLISFSLAIFVTKLFILL
ncbi:hypothetical protein ABPG74_007980 [Tetrahymena malaccensis]